MTCTSGTSYIVKAGDTLFLIAQQQLGNGNLWPEIKNPDGSSPNPNDLQVGQELCLPNTGSSGFAKIVSSSTFASLFPNRNSLYTYESLLAAIQQYPTFCNQGTGEQSQREAAAFLANISHETGQLVYVDEQNPPNNYCDPSSTAYPCAAGQSYHGRGPIQLSWNYNYGACGDAIGRGLLAQPELVSTNSVITWQTALWFWMTAQTPNSSCHDAISASGFGKTIDIINGAIECGQTPPSPQAQDRVSLYQRYCGVLGVTPGGNLYC
jgi:basic endochitinase B